MPAARTTEQLIVRSIAAARAAGLPIRSVRVAPGGIVEIVAGDPEPELTFPEPKGNTCDALFGGPSD